MHTKRTAGGIQSVGKTSRDREASGSNLISARSNLFKCIEGGEADRRINNEANHKLKKKHMSLLETNVLLKVKLTWLHGSA